MPSSSRRRLVVEVSEQTATMPIIFPAPGWIACHIHLQQVIIEGQHIQLAACLPLP